VAGSPAEVAEALALAKARAVAGRRGPGIAAVGADTLVALGARVFGKPADAAAARATLEALRGRTHEVLSGVAVACGGRAMSALVTTRVTMRAYSDAELAAYVASGDPLDKSGAYAVQHPTFAPAAAVDGCRCSVIGLPLWTLRRLLATVAGIVTAEPAFERCADCPERMAAAETACRSPLGDAQLADEGR
jgi:septum formation protein